MLRRDERLGNLRRGRLSSACRRDANPGSQTDPEVAPRFLPPGVDAFVSSLPPSPQAGPVTAPDQRHAATGRKDAGNRSLHVAGDAIELVNRVSLP